MGSRYPLIIGEESGERQCPSPEFILFFGSRNAYFGAFSDTPEYLLLHCNSSRPRPLVRLPSLAFQTDCGSIKGAGVPAEDGTEHLSSLATNTRQI